MRFLILAHPADVTALGLYQTLATRHEAAQVVFVSSEALVFAPHWRHTLEGGETRTVVTLRSGVVLDSHEVGVVFNRLRYIHLPHFARAAPEDQEYAVTEMYALWLSWLAGLPCPVINPPSPRGLGAQERSQVEWLALAARAGLNTPAYAATTDSRRYPETDLHPYREGPPNANGAGDRWMAVPRHQVAGQPTLFIQPPGSRQASICVIGDRVLGAPSEEIAVRLQSLRALSGCEVFQVDLASDGFEANGGAIETNGGEDWAVYTVDPFPTWRGAAELDALAQRLETLAVTEAAR